MKICSQCNTQVSDEYQFCLNCGNAVGTSSARAEEPLPTLVYQGPISQPSSMPPTIPHAVSPTSSIGSRRQPWLPWFLVAACVVAILVLIVVIAFQRKSSVAETTATPQVTLPTPTPTPPELALTSTSNQPSPISSMSPEVKKQVTPTPTPSPSGVVDNSQSVPSATPTPPVSTPTPTPIASPTVDPNRVYSNREVSERARIASKPKPGYTEEARKNQIQGVVVLKVVLRSDGTIGNISVVSGLPYGLTERAIASARNIRFTPALKDGVPVSVSVQVEYGFSLY